MVTFFIVGSGTFAIPNEERDRTAPYNASGIVRLTHGCHMVSGNLWHRTIGLICDNDNASNMQSNGEDKSGLLRRSERGLIRSQQAWNPHERKIRVTSCNYAFSQTTSCCPQHEPKLPPYLQHAMGDEATQDKPASRPPAGATPNNLLSDRVRPGVDVPVVLVAITMPRRYFSACVSHITLTGQGAGTGEWGQSTSPRLHRSVELRVSLLRW
ncbi:hypothetical protein V8E53_009498 [Lactarius tabidus]